MLRRPSRGPVIYDEIFDDDSAATHDEVVEYAKRIGIDPAREPHLLHIANEGVNQSLPAGWKPCFEEDQGALYYFNFGTGETRWEHPLDATYREKVAKARRQLGDLGTDAVAPGPAVHERSQPSRRNVWFSPSVRQIQFDVEEEEEDSVDEDERAPSAEPRRGDPPASWLRQKLEPRPAALLPVHWADGGDDSLEMAHELTEDSQSSLRASEGSEPPRAQLERHKEQQLRAALAERRLESRRSATAAAAAADETPRWSPSPTPDVPTASTPGRLRPLAPLGPVGTHRAPLAPLPGIRPAATAARPPLPTTLAPLGKPTVRATKPAGSPAVQTQASSASQSKGAKEQTNNQKQIEKRFGSTVEVTEATSKTLRNPAGPFINDNARSPIARRPINGTSAITPAATIKPIGSPSTHKTDPNVTAAESKTTTPANVPLTKRTTQVTPRSPVKSKVSANITSPSRTNAKAPTSPGKSAIASNPAALPCKAVAASNSNVLRDSGSAVPHTMTPSKTAVGLKAPTSPLKSAASLMPVSPLKNAAFRQWSISSGKLPSGQATTPPGSPTALSRSTTSPHKAAAGTGFTTSPVKVPNASKQAPPSESAHISPASPTKGSTASGAGTMTVSEPKPAQQRPTQVKDISYQGGRRKLSFTERLLARKVTEKQAAAVANQDRTRELTRGSDVSVPVAQKAQTDADITSSVKTAAARKQWVAKDVSGSSEAKITRDLQGKEVEVTGARGVRQSGDSRATADAAATATGITNISLQRATESTVGELIPFIDDVTEACPQKPANGRDSTAARAGADREHHQPLSTTHSSPESTTKSGSTESQSSEQRTDVTSSSGDSSPASTNADKPNEAVQERQPEEASTGVTADASTDDSSGPVEQIIRTHESKAEANVAVSGNVSGTLPTTPITSLARPQTSCGIKKVKSVELVSSPTKAQGVSCAHVAVSPVSTNRTSITGPRKEPLVSSKRTVCDEPMDDSERIEDSRAAAPVESGVAGVTNGGRTHSLTNGSSAIRLANGARNAASENGDTVGPTTAGGGTVSGAVSSEQQGRTTLPAIAASVQSALLPHNSTSQPKSSEPGGRDSASPSARSAAPADCVVSFSLLRPQLSPAAHESDSESASSQSDSAAMRLLRLQRVTDSQPRRTSEMESESDSEQNDNDIRINVTGRLSLKSAAANGTIDSLKQTGETLPGDQPGENGNDEGGGQKAATNQNDHSNKSDDLGGLAEGSEKGMNADLIPIAALGLSTAKPVLNEHKSSEPNSEHCQLDNERLPGGWHQRTHDVSTCTESRWITPGEDLTHTSTAATSVDRVDTGVQVSSDIVRTTKVAQATRALQTQEEEATNNSDTRKWAQPRHHSAAAVCGRCRGHLTVSADTSASDSSEEEAAVPPAATMSRSCPQCALGTRRWCGAASFGASPSASSPVLSAAAVQQSARSRRRRSGVPLARGSATKQRGDDQRSAEAAGQSGAAQLTMQLLQRRLHRLQPSGDTTPDGHAIGGALQRARAFLHHQCRPTGDARVVETSSDDSDSVSTGDEAPSPTEQQTRVQATARRYRRLKQDRVHASEPQLVAAAGRRPAAYSPSRAEQLHGSLAAIHTLRAPRRRPKPARLHWSGVHNDALDTGPAHRRRTGDPSPAASGHGAAREPRHTSGGTQARNGGNTEGCVVDTCGGWSGDGVSSNRRQPPAQLSLLERTRQLKRWLRNASIAWAINSLDA